MKVAKKHNPYDVQIGQKWVDCDESRPNVFEIKKLFMADGIAYAEVYREITSKTSKIKLSRFGRYLLKK